jgi:5-methylcytosine-specific restriction endonuclease McrA
MADTLVLNADGLPVSYLPLSTVQWKEAVTYLWLDKVTVLDWYDDWVVRSATWETRVPAVIMMKEMMRRRKTPRFSKTNVFLRDLNTCQYCDTQFPKSILTLDHVVPLSRGGKTCWDNIVSACGPCNARKGNKMEPRPLRRPYQPDYYELVNKRKQLEFDIRHPSWEAWLK